MAERTYELLTNKLEIPQAGGGRRFSEVGWWVEKPRQLKTLGK
jgi:hypothetical protein